MKMNIIMILNSCDAAVLYGGLVGSLVFRDDNFLNLPVPLPNNIP